MKLFTGWAVSAGLVLAAGAASAQGLAPNETGGRLIAVSDVGGPYAAMPPEAPMPGYGPTLLPPQEVYLVVRESGFLPLTAPQLRGAFYTIDVTSRRGDDGRMLIDARNGQILRFLPAYRMGGSFNEDVRAPYGPSGPLPPMSHLAGVPRPPASVPQVASRTPPVPLPKPPPARAGEARPLVEKPVSEPMQSAAVQTKPADTQVPAARPPVIEAKPPAPQIQPTQPMPQVQGLE
jgi:hypothetical protein